jgi:hypothetical protein
MLHHACTAAVARGTVVAGVTDPGSLGLVKTMALAAHAATGLSEPGYSAHLLATIFDEQEWKLGIGFMTGLIVFAAAIGAWRSLTGTDRTKADVRIESDFVTHAQLDSRLQGLASEIERKFEKALHEEFKQLNGERSRSIGNLHEKIETTADGLRAELNEVRGMIVDMPARLVEMLRTGRR